MTGTTQTSWSCASPPHSAQVSNSNSRASHSSGVSSILSLSQGLMMSAPSPEVSAEPFDECLDPLVVHSELSQTEPQSPTPLGVELSQPADDIVRGLPGTPLPGLVEQVRPVHAVHAEVQGDPQAA